ncbi:MAG: hypothetical protein KF680_04030 [Cryobacterium sp.]|nr:hypothetical protein [Cryobacterium sp.]
MKRVLSATTVAALVAAVLIGGVSPALAAPDPVPGDPLTGTGVGTRTVLTSANLASTANPGGVVDSTAGFGVPAYAAPALHNFQGTLRINNINATTTGTSSLYDPYNNVYFSTAFWYRYLPYSGNIATTNYYLQQQFTQNGSHLIPTTRGFQYLASLNWDILWGVGRTWSEAGDVIGGNPASRASIPFTLVFKEENCAFNGLMTFLYNDTTTSRVRYQVSSETCSYFKGNMWGNLTSTYTPGVIANADAIGSAYALEVANRMPTKPLSALVTDYPSAGFDLSALTAGTTAAHITNYGFVYNGVNYLGACVTRTANTLTNAAGLHPFCEQLGLPSYSTAKSIFMGGALMMLGEKYGESVYDELVRDWVPEVAGIATWSDVTFNNLVDMASGHYTSSGNQVDEDGSVMASFFGITNTTRAQKMPFATSYPYQVAPGTQWVYHTSDSFILSAAMNAYLKDKEGASADIWSTFYADVLTPLGISPDASATKRTTGANSTPWGGYGLFWTPDDLAKIGAFFAGGDGSHGGTQLLNADMVADSLQQDPTDTGLSTGTGFSYNNSFWARPFTAADNAAFTTPFSVPFMSGFGGISVVLMPNCSVFYRVGDNAEFSWAGIVSESHKLDSMLNPSCAAGPTPEPTTLADDSETTAYETQVTVDVLDNDGLLGEPALDASTLALLDGTTPVTTLTVTGGTFAVVSGQIQFTPAASFSGSAGPVTYQVTNVDGVVGTATITITVGAAPQHTTMLNDTASTAFQTAVTVDVLGNDGLPGEPALDASTLALLDGTTPVTSLTITEGVFEVVGGQIQFTPSSSHTGPVSAVTYQAENAEGVVGTATLTVTVGAAPQPSTLANDTANTSYETAVTIDVLGNDGLGGEPALDSTTLTLLDGTTPVTTLTVAGGTFTVVSGQIQFTPAASFSGAAGPVTYRVTNLDGVSGTATLTVTVDAAPPATTTLVNDTPSAAFGATVLIDVLGNDGTGGEPALDPSTLALLDGTTPVSTLTVTGGVFTVLSGRVQFVPTGGFSGAVAPVTYQVTNVEGATMTATLSLTVSAASGSGSGTGSGGGALGGTGVEGVLPLTLVALGALLLGAVLLVLRRVRTRDA